MRARHNALAKLTAFAPVSSQDASCHTGKYFTSVMLCDWSQFTARNIARNVCGVVLHWLLECPDPTLVALSLLEIAFVAFS
jgi:hypothetical protein